MVQTLAASGYRVRAATRSAHRSLFLKTAGLVGQVEPVIVDITNPISVSQALSGAHYFINAVGTLFENKRGMFQALHVDFPTLLSQCAHEQGCLGGIHISALDTSSDHPSAYSRTKAAGEQAIRSHMPNTIIVRPSLVFGPQDRFFNVLAALSRLLPVMPVVATPARFQPVYVGDVARGVERLIQSHDVYSGQVFEWGGPCASTLTDITTAILRIVHREQKWLAPIPLSLVMMAAKLIGWIPYAPLTPDQVHLLKQDSVVSDAAHNNGQTLAGLGLSTHAFEDVASQWLSRFRPGGEYSERAWK